MSRNTSPRAGAFLLVALAALTHSGCDRSGADAPPGPTPYPVRVAAVQVATVSPPIRGTGLLGPKDEVTLGFKIGGVIDRILVDESTRVRQGQMLAALDLREIDAQVVRAKSAAQKADRDLARTRRLYADSVATLEQVQNAETGADVARATLEAAEFDRRYAVIVAPGDGIVLRRHSEPGELVSPGLPVLTLASNARGAVVRVGLADRDAVRIQPGDPATVRLDVAPERIIEGVVSEIAPAADPGTGTFRVEIQVSGWTGLASGLVADVEIRPANGRPLPLIPVEALLEADGARATVFAVAPGSNRAESRVVTIAFLADDRVAIASGLEGVQQVVTDGALRLDDGDAVQVVP